MNRFFKIVLQFFKQKIIEIMEFLVLLLAIIISIALLVLIIKFTSESLACYGILYLGLVPNVIDNLATIGFGYFITLLMLCIIISVIFYILPIELYKFLKENWIKATIIVDSKLNDVKK